MALISLDAPVRVISKQTEIDFGTTPITEQTFTIADGDVQSNSRIVGFVSYEAPTGKDLDEIEMDELAIHCAPNGAQSLTMYVRALEGLVADKFRITYLVSVT
jgi:hypothetical protein